jgi:hypothetical protein
MRWSNGSTWVQCVCETCEGRGIDGVFEVYGYLEVADLPDGREVFFDPSDTTTVTCPNDNGDEHHDVSIVGG